MDCQFLNCFGFWMMIWKKEFVACLQHLQTRVYWVLLEFVKLRHKSENFNAPKTEKLLFMCVKQQCYFYFQKYFWWFLSCFIICEFPMSLADFCYPDPHYWYGSWKPKWSRSTSLLYRWSAEVFGGICPGVLGLLYSQPFQTSLRGSDAINSFLQGCIKFPATWYFSPSSIFWSLDFLSQYFPKNYPIIHWSINTE